MINPSHARLSLKTPLLPGLFFLALIMQILDPGKVWIILLVALGLTWFSAYFWASRLAKNISISREKRFGWAQVGDRLEERFTLTNRGWIPAPWIEIIDHSNMPDYAASQVRGVDGNAATSWRTQGICSRRGVFRLGPTGLRTRDPLGVYQIELVNPASTTLFIMPPIVPLPLIDIVPGGRTGDARPRSNALERTVSASSVREYVPGDSMHLIHWRTTARRDTPFVRIFDGTPAGDWWIILDLDRKVQIGEGWDATDEHAIILAASLADRGLRSGRAVGLAASSEPLIWLHPKEGDHQLWSILKELAQASRGTCSLHDFIFRMSPSLSKQSSLLIITPNMDEKWLEALFPVMRKGAIPTVLILDAMNWKGSSISKLVYAEARQIIGQLAEIGVHGHLIPQSLLDKPEARPGKEGQWEWRTTPRGRAVAVRQPTDQAWKAIT
jgi:uncharacterized protein (DUF58 family)